jgi:YfiH family protein
VTAIGWLEPDWGAPTGVRAVTTLRWGGVSRAPYESLNLGGHVGDDPLSVAENRRRLVAALDLPGEPHWLEQVHGLNVHRIPGAASGPADAAVTRERGQVLAVLTADCLPVVLAAGTGGALAVAHAGWRGLLAGVLEETLAALGGQPASVVAWLGPAIGPVAYEVGDEVRDAFVGRCAGAEKAFRPSPAGRWFCDLYRLAGQRLRAAGVTRISGGDHCTLKESGDFFSYRRDGRTGRMATLAWLT